jgi:soluble lytic murein transglycosylase
VILASVDSKSAAGREVNKLAEIIHRKASLRTLLPWAFMLVVTGTVAQTTPATKPKPHHHASSATHAKTTTRAKAGVRHVKTRRKPRSAKSIARSRKLQMAFVASSQLRPMAQELTTMRSPAAYAGVTAYAHAHTGEAASAAYLALGHA